LHNCHVEYGYIRISTADQNPDLPRDALNKAGCIKIFEDKGIADAHTERLGTISPAAGQFHAGTVTRTTQFIEGRCV